MFKSRDRVQPKSLRVSGLEPIHHMKCTNRLLGRFGSSYWNHTIFLHMRSCRCKNFEFWSPGTQVTFFCVKFIEYLWREITYRSNHISLGLTIFQIWTWYKKGIFHQKTGLIEHLEPYQKFWSQKNLYSGFDPETVMFLRLIFLFLLLKGVNSVSEKLSQI